MARNGVNASAIAEAIGCPAPLGPETAATGSLRMIGTGPGTWLALQTSADPLWVSFLSARLSGIASVSDQSGGYVLFRIHGPQARELLQRGAFVDLDPAVFGPDAVATTTIAHIGVILWRVGDDAFDIALFRSFASSFKTWFADTAATLPFPPY
jgi:heterotetrameric sarcosine oxidase gamma subunit